MKYKLTTPFTDSFKVERTALDVREVVLGRDILEARRETKDPFEQMFGMVARMCGLDRKDVEAMDARDIDAICELIEGFRSPKSPAESSPTQ